jgi:hypothetical protein
VSRGVVVAPLLDQFQLGRPQWFGVAGAHQLKQARARLQRHAPASSRAGSLPCSSAQQGQAAPASDEPNRKMGQGLQGSVKRPGRARGCLPASPCVLAGAGVGPPAGVDGDQNACYRVAHPLLMQWRTPSGGC